MSSPTNRGEAAPNCHHMAAVEAEVLDRYLTWLRIEASHVGRVLGYPPGEIRARLTMTSFDWHAARQAETAAMVAERARDIFDAAGVHEGGAP